MLISAIGAELGAPLPPLPSPLNAMVASGAGQAAFLSRWARWWSIEEGTRAPVVR
jgi:hypothetical protein